LIAEVAAAIDGAVVQEPVIDRPLELPDLVVGEEDPRDVGSHKSHSGGAWRRIGLRPHQVLEHCGSIADHGNPYPYTGGGLDRTGGAGTFADALARVRRVVDSARFPFGEPPVRRSGRPRCRTRVPFRPWETGTHPSTRSTTSGSNLARSRESSRRS